MITTPGAREPLATKGGKVRYSPSPFVSLKTGHDLLSGKKFGPWGEVWPRSVPSRGIWHWTLRGVISPGTCLCTLLTLGYLAYPPSTPAVRIDYPRNTGLLDRRTGFPKLSQGIPQALSEKPSNRQPPTTGETMRCSKIGRSPREE